jgi:hypothetical protein
VSNVQECSKAGLRKSESGEARISTKKTAAGSTRKIPGRGGVRGWGSLIPH